MDLLYDDLYTSYICMKSIMFDIFKNCIVVLWDFEYVLLLGTMLSDASGGKFVWWSQIHNIFCYCVLCKLELNF
jgi:hypothetical protein